MNRWNYIDIALSEPFATNTTKYLSHIQAYFLGDNLTPSSNRIADLLHLKISSAICGWIYNAHKRYRFTQSKMLLHNNLPQVYDAQMRARVDGGLSGDYQFVRLWELWLLLNRFNPDNALELGSGASSFVFGYYFQDSRKFTSIEESAYWLERTQAALGDCSDWVTFMLAPRQLSTEKNELACHYKIDHNNYFDCVYVDGPTNLTPDGTFGPDGHTPHIACEDVVLFWENNNFPRFLIVDGRRATVRRFILTGHDRYQMFVKTDYLLCDKPIAYRYHCVFIRSN